MQAGWWNNLVKEVKSTSTYIGIVSPKEVAEEESNYQIHYQKKCSGNYIYWYDSNNVRKDYVQSCSYGCTNGVCNSAPKTTTTNSKTTISTSSSTTYVRRDSKGCYGNYAYWYDSNNKRSDYIAYCRYGCSNGECITSTGTTKSSSSTSTSSTKYSATYPIIFIHGWYGDLNTFSDMQDKLDSEGIAEDKGSIYSSSSTSSLCRNKWSKAVSVNFEYYDPERNMGIDTYARKLSSAIDTLKNCTNSQKVNIVAHSMGGLIARTYMLNGGSSNVNKLIMLETPNYGSPLATSGAGTDANSMIPGSTFLSSLNSNRKECEYREKMVNIGSETLLDGLFDNGVKDFASRDVCKSKSILEPQSIICPINCAFLKGANNIKISGCGHTDLVASGVASPSCTDAYNNVKQYIK